jgi:hypothetical protein
MPSSSSATLSARQALLASLQLRLRFSFASLLSFMPSGVVSTPDGREPRPKNMPPNRSAAIARPRPRFNQRDRVICLDAVKRQIRDIQHVFLADNHLATGLAVVTYSSFPSTRRACAIARKRIQAHRPLRAVAVDDGIAIAPEHCLREPCLNPDRLADRREIQKRKQAVFGSQPRALFHPLGKTHYYALTRSTKLRPVYSDPLATDKT